MSGRMFALLIGIDIYKSTTISNLQSCAEDAKRMRNWLVDEFNVPIDHICLLLDSKATKENIEICFMEHLVNNSFIGRGDAIIIYFAGRGSYLSAPTDWFQDDASAGVVQVICPHDYDVKLSQGRNAGISDRSFHALLEDVISAKGDNVTIILDCCFSPTETPGVRNRHSTRWTKPTKAVPDDLYSCLWIGARGKPSTSRFGFFDPMSLHTVLAACPPGGKALESIEGGNFTTCFLHAAAYLPLHRTSYAYFIDYLRQEVGDHDQFFCSGKQKDKTFFDGIPFVPDNHFFSASLENDSANLVRINLGAMHGVTAGTDISLHLHNYSFSFNPPLAVSCVFEVQPSSSLALLGPATSGIPRSCCAKISKWNNPCPLRIYLKPSFTSFIRFRTFKNSLSIKRGRGFTKSGINVLRVRQKDLADVSIRLDVKNLLIEHKQVLSEYENGLMKVADKHTIQAVDAAAQFCFQLLRKNTISPLRNLIDMEIHRFDVASSLPIGENLLQEGVALIPYKRGDVYSIKFQNNSHIDIWPYVAYMDPTLHSIILLYNPKPTCRKAPLPKNGSLEIGPDTFPLGSGTLSLDLFEYGNIKSVYLKLFFSSIPVNLKVLEQDPIPEWFSEESSVQSAPCSPSDEIEWDTALASLIFVLDSESREANLA
ncbi:hypothetical protein CPB84DRAFT_1772985 [Gymnopilus junonius]|uniref:Peptidase C14 caspase domain-containing protein n=1 Tax=Gymnopilus junonius TaxID=109634 RepID=A0A9P5TQ14_GYMJU|nr:hypothetical protein CPB84DRAFT_1772985 [Gymnopilus junonius]